MYPEIRYHTFETRLVKQDGDYVFLRLSKDADGNFYFISKSPINCRLYKPSDINSLIEELKKAAELPILDAKDIR